MNPRRRRRRGFTLIELLVVISIIGILVGLLLPAINSAREAGRRVQCQSNMKNVVLGIIGYVTTKNVFPPSGVFGEIPTDTGFLTDPTKGAIASWMPGGSGSIGQPMYSWVVPILPYLDSQELFDQWSMFATTTQGPVTVNYLDGMTGTATANLTSGQATNFKIGNTSIGVLRCPDDNTFQTGSGKSQLRRQWRVCSLPCLSRRVGRLSHRRRRGYHRADDLVNSDNRDAELHPIRHWNGSKDGSDVPGISFPARHHDPHSLER